MKYLCITGFVAIMKRTLEVFLHELLNPLKFTVVTMVSANSMVSKD